MILDLTEIPDAGLEIDRSIELREPGPDGRGRLVSSPLRLVGRAASGPRGVDLRARFEASARLECSRCLDPFAVPLEIDFELTLVPPATEFGGPEQRLDPADATLFYVENGRVDLCEVVREQIWLHLPLKPVCRPDCGGLCPTCGANRNRIECACRSAEPDPRFAPLLDWKKTFGGPARDRASTSSGTEDDGEPQT